MGSFTSEVDTLINASLSQNTVKSYQTAISLFDSFRLHKSFPLDWPASLDSIVSFTAYLSLSGYSYSTASSYISGISFYFKINGWDDLTQAFIVRKMLKGYSKFHSRKDLRDPVTLYMLNAFPRALKQVTQSNYEAFLFQTMFSTSFFGLMRIGELVVQSKESDCSKVVQIADVSITSSEVWLNVRFSKTDQSGRSVTLIFTPCSDKEICPVALLSNYVKHRPQLRGPLFCHFSGLPVTRFQFSAILAKAIKFLGIKQVVRPHSFRIGATTLACQQKICDNDIRAMGRWSDSSQVFKRYIRLDKLQA